MATELKNRFQIDLRGVVANSINTVKIVRRQTQARNESEFQRAIADGLSYEDQIAIRTKQLEEAKKGGGIDEEYVAKLEQSIADTKKLQRFNKYRTTYTTTLGELSAGKINEEEYLKKLEGMLTGVDDDELRIEIQGDIAAAHKQVKLYHDTILVNQVKKLKYDGTEKSLSEAITKVKAARFQAALDKNEDEVTAYDETLAALNSQYSTVKVQDSLTNFQVKSSTKGTNPLEKLNFINSEIRKADDDTVVRIGDRSYKSAAEFWQLERDAYLQGTSQIFGNFFEEVGVEAQNAINSHAARFGYPTQAILDKQLSEFNEIRSRAEVQPFLSKMDITQATVMSNAINNLAKTINAVGTNNLTFKEADAQLQAISTKYGIDTSAFRLQLDENMRNQLEQDAAKDIKSEFSQAEVNIELPKVDAENPASPNVLTPNVAQVLAASRVVKSGENLSTIAAEENLTLNALLDLNPELKANPNLVRSGQTLKLPDKVMPQAPAPAPKEEPKTTTKASDRNTETKPATTTKTPTTTAPKPVAQTPAPTPAPAPAPKSSYTGVSIVDYLASTGQDSSFGARSKMAAQNGITGYQGTAEQNTALLKKLRGF